jgi:serine/threonine protein kinase/Flp pilus assembly protein TadD
MTKRNWATSAETMITRGHASPARDCSLVSAIKADWEAGQTPDAMRALAAHPELAENKSVVLDLAYEEFCRREELGEQIDVDRFCERFPLHRRSVRRRLDVHRYIEREVFPQETPAPWPAAHEVFCGFELLEEIGQGAIGRVYLARQAALGNRTVVLKLSRGGRREARLLGMLDHPNVIPVYSIDQDPKSGLASVCMPYLGLATFEDVLDQIASLPVRPQTGAVFDETVKRMNGSLPSDNKVRPQLGRQSFVNTLLGQFAQVAEALAYLHGKGICHRDLKPSNILLTNDGRPVLLDFNLSAEMATSESRLGGTLPYMAPEQIKGMLNRAANQLDARADVFSMGVILYEMLSSTLPFGPVSKNLSLERAGSLRLDQQARGADLVRLRRAGVDREVVSIVGRCLEFDPADRFPGAEAAAAALRRALRPSARAARWVRTHLLWTVLTAMLLLATVGFGATWLALREPFYKVRFREGVAAYERGEMNAALAAFEESKLANPEFVGALYGIASAQLALGQYLSASDEYQQLHERTGEPQYLASAGYCKSLLMKHKEAMAFYTDAIEHGFGSEIVSNNLGYSVLRLGGIAEARKHLNDALSINGQFRAALQNRAMLELQAASPSSAKPRQVPDHSVDDIEAAIRLAPGFGNVHFHAAFIWALSGRPDRWSAVISHAEKAVELGFQPVRFRQSSAFKPVMNDPRMRALMERAPGKNLDSDPPAVLDPSPSKNYSKFF